MAHSADLLIIPASAFIGDNDAQLVGGDVLAPLSAKKGRPVLVFDDTAEAAATSPEYAMPASFAGGTLKATVFGFAATNAADGVVFDVFVEAKTPDTDTLDLETATSWDSANSSGDWDLSGTTAGDPTDIEVTLTNKDSVAAGDLVRFGIRRDTDHANDDASGDFYILAIVIWEDV